MGSIFTTDGRLFVPAQLVVNVVKRHMVGLYLLMCCAEFQGETEFAVKRKTKLKSELQDRWSVELLKRNFPHPRYAIPGRTSSTHQS